MATLDCGFKCAKYFLFIFNFVFWAAGAVLLAIGIWFLVDGNALRWLHVSSLSTDQGLLKAAAIIIIVVGGLMFIVGGLGCCGACREVAECLIAFAAILLILLLAQLATGILAGIFYDKIVMNVEQRMNETIQTKYGKANASSETLAWDMLQTEMSCCGLFGYTDWVGSWWHSNNNMKPTWPVPATCCRLTNQDFRNPMPLNATLCSTVATNYNATIERSLYLNAGGCEASFKAWVKSHLGIIIGVAIGIILIQIIGLSVACCLGMQIRNKGTIS